ncbi:MAG: RNA methyltransferase [Nitrospiraceae bacterium]|nr:MAG: RNA methyltransferase [Nitrospiraceae bacterium]
MLLFYVKNWKDNISFILVEPKEPGNIGAAARAIKNMGFKNLSLVRPASHLTDEARWFAHGAHDVLESAKIFPSLTDAIKDKSIVAGTSRRKGRKRGLFFHVEQGAQKLYEIARKNKTAILFGREDRGLFNNEIEACGFLMTIPADKNQPSLNLAQAALITAYELSKAEYAPSQSFGSLNRPDLHSISFPELATQAEMMALFMRIEDMLKALEYFPNGTKDLGKKIIKNLKHYFGRAGLTDWELKLLHGLCTRIIKQAKKE